MISKKIKYLETNKEYSKIYDIHKYWSRKPWLPISEHIQKYSNENDLVVDLFVGSGVTALESIILNRNFIGYDLNPIAIFIANLTIFHEFDEDRFKKELEFIEKELNDLEKELYSSEEKCPICNENLILQYAVIGPKHKNKEKGIFFCKKCGKRKTRVEKNLTKYEMSLDEYPIEKWVPQVKFPHKFYKDRFSYKGVKEIKDMFTPRNWYFLSELHHIINNSELQYKYLFLLAFTNTLLHVSKLKSENVRPLSVNNYWIPDDYIEENVLFRFHERALRILSAKKILKKRIGNKQLGKAILKNQSSLNTGLDNESVDYIITDPPYGDTIQYSELSYIWNAWIKKPYDTEEEIIINPAQGKDLKNFFSLMDRSIYEASRILKKDKFITITFHNKDFRIWKGILDILKKHNFVLVDIEIINTKGNSYNINWAKFSPKTDLYLTFKKTKYKPIYYKEYSIRTLLEEIIKEISNESIPDIYDLLCVKLIKELYFNKYQIDVNDLTIKKIGNYIEEIKNGN